LNLKPQQVIQSIKTRIVA